MPTVGIYKITSPTNKVYIGQSINIENRMSHYKYLCDSIKKQRKLNYSLSKYGFQSHKFEIVHELPKDTHKDILNNYEKLYMGLYIGCGVELLNLKEGGLNGRHSDETKEKIRSKLIGRIFSPETIDKIRIASFGKESPMNGKKHSDETKIKMSESHKKRDKSTFRRGHKLTPEHIAKWKASMTWAGFRGKHTEETKRKISETKKGCKGVRNKAIICVNTGTTYSSIRDAAKVIGMKESTLAMQLRGCSPNKTTLKYA